MTDRTLPPVVRGEIQPWTDRNPAGGPALTGFLADLLPDRPGRVLVAGPHHTGVLDLVASRSDDVTVLLRSVSDAEAVRGNMYAVVTGALDGLADEKPEPFDVVIAADGLDRLLGPDSAALDWPERAALLRGLAGPAALVVIGVENGFSITGLLDRRPAKDRYGDDEWRPLHDDPRRPGSAAQVNDLLGGVQRRYARFGEHTLLESGALTRTQAGFPAMRLAVAALEASDTPLLASVGDAAEAAARSGMLDAVAPGWLVVLGSGGATHTVYTPAGAADLAADGWHVGDRVVPDVEDAETVLLRLAAAEDVPGFRAYAANLDAVRFDGDPFQASATASRSSDAFERSANLAAAWFRFRHRLIGGHHRHPWPPWMTDGDDLVKMWLAMSGTEPTDEILTRGREIAGTVPDGRPALAGTVPDVSDVPDLRTALADADQARATIKEQAGHIFGLERTMRFRDQQLRTREQQLRNLRDELRRLKSGRSAKVAATISRVARLRDPKHLAGAVKKRAKAFLLR
ncbi:hypothetical protein [Actinoplanes derwentensis]|uniref:Uncharacterized protein n=1 Tax=Actinoplanes derwentensis TaxID=113562 RepID=A0A1H2DBS6_9ACTN|nr:hypothetical protein [Actinoplanes derwentensis]GID81730.1 hypothetical protein Ade03nite_06540 [Actinoplanes derwentensis]SDT79706.1 hypothetical protein SAMN04489716_8899 [Actinoplanes derwentensis]